MRRIPVLPSGLAAVLLAALAASPPVGSRVAAIAGEHSRPVLGGPERPPLYEHGEGGEPGDLTWPWNLGLSGRDWIVIVCFVAFLVFLARWPGGNRGRRRWPAGTTSARLFDLVTGRRSTGEYGNGSGTGPATPAEPPGEHGRAQRTSGGSRGSVE